MDTVRQYFVGQPHPTEVKVTVKVTSRVPVKVPGPGGPEVWPVRPALASYGVLNPNLNPILSSAIFALQKKKITIHNPRIRRRSVPNET